MKLSRAALVCGLVLAGDAARGMAPMSLPDFPLTALDSRILYSAELPNHGRWLLVYVMPASHPSRTFLGVLNKKQQRLDVARIVVVVRGTIDAARAVAEGCPNLADASWYADPEGKAFARLRLVGVPTVLGLRGRTAEWKLNGTLPDAELRSVLLSWLGADASPMPQP